MSLHPLQHYHYEITENNIGKIPTEPRDHAKLLVYDTATETLIIDRFYNLSLYLPPSSLLVLNKTAVIPARVYFRKDTGGKVEGLFLYNEGIQTDGTIPIIVNKQILVGRKLYLGKYEFTVLRHEEQYFYLLPSFDSELLPHILSIHGTTPTPKYLGKLTLQEDTLRKRYQTVFADANQKSVAAPTASLHFTEDVLHSLKEKNIETTDVLLHVGMGTFAEVSENHLITRKLHTEPVEISLSSIQTIRTRIQSQQPIIAVGTTAMRTLESQAHAILNPNFNSDIQTSTDIFIYPPYSFQIANGLITNFHVPKSSLMALVDAFLQNKGAKKSILEIYQYALENDFKFFSFGDSMMVI